MKKLLLLLTTLSTAAEVGAALDLPVLPPDGPAPARGDHPTHSGHPRPRALPRGEAVCQIAA